MGKLLMIIAVFAAGYLCGDQAPSLAIDTWQDLAEAARPKLENL